MRFTIALLLVAVNVSVFGQSNPPLKVREVDGTPTKSGINTLVVSNGSLSINGTTATVTTGVSGLSDVSGTLVSSSNFRVPATGGTASAPNLQLGTGGNGLHVTGNYVVVSTVTAGVMAWEGATGDTRIRQSYSLTWGSVVFDSPDIGLRRASAGVLRVTDGTKNAAGYGQVEAKGVTLNATAFASLGTPSNGTILYCSDCTVANPCASGGTGALAKRLNGVWVCN
jgi:hypothetical protein